MHAPTPSDTSPPTTTEHTADSLADEISRTDPGPPLDDARDWHDPEDRHEMIAEAAYYRAEQRGFELGHEDMDWLAAEEELIERMAKDPAPAVY